MYQCQQECFQPRTTNAYLGQSKFLVCVHLAVLEVRNIKKKVLCQVQTQTPDFPYSSVVGGITAPGCPSIIPGSFEYVTLPNKRDFPHSISEGRLLNGEIILGCLGRASGITGSQKQEGGGKGRVQGDVTTEEAVRQSGSYAAGFGSEEMGSRGSQATVP